MHQASCVLVAVCCGRMCTKLWQGSHSHSHTHTTPAQASKLKRNPLGVALESQLGAGAYGVVRMCLSYAAYSSMYITKMACVVMVLLRYVHDGMYMVHAICHMVYL